MAGIRRIIDDALYVHFVTFSVSQRRRLFEFDQPKRILLGVLNAVLEQYAARCVGFVIIPEHVHALVWFPVVDQLSPFMQSWKRRSSLLIRAWYREHVPAMKPAVEASDRFWQPKYYAFEIYEPAKLEEKLTYMHLNPVRRGLVARTIDWPWSSARWYELGRTVGVPLQWVD
jgi:putative transposase